MKRSVNTAARLIGWASSALALAALSASAGASAQAQGDGVLPSPCSTSVVVTTFGGGTYLDPAKSPACKAAIPVLRSAAVIVVGDVKDADIANWINVLSANAQWKAKFNDGLNFGGAVTFLKGRVAGAGAAERAKAIDNAFAEVYGRASSPQEQAYWETQVKAQKAWYATIVGELVKELQAEPLKKQGAIIRAYKSAMGREPTVEDGQYWQARGDHYRQIRDAARAYLYSPNGAKDLAETVARALQAKTGQKPGDEAVKKAMATFTGQKLIYEEMVKK